MKDPSALSPVIQHKTILRPASTSCLAGGAGWESHGVISTGHSQLAPPFLKMSILADNVN